MIVRIITPQGHRRQHPDATTSLVAEAELEFERGEDLAGLKIVGFSIRKNAKGGVFVTLPARDFQVGKERHYFWFVRSADSMSYEAGKAALDSLRQRIIDEWQKTQPSGKGGDHDSVRRLSHGATTELEEGKTAARSEGKDQALLERQPRGEHAPEGSSDRAH